MGTNSVSTILPAVVSRQEVPPNTLTLSPRMSIDSALALIGQPIYFMQVGAFDGISGDPIYHRVARWHLQGALIEPQPDAFKALRRNYAQVPGAFKFINAAISSVDGMVRLYRVSPESDGPGWLYQIASLKRSTVMYHAHEVHGLKEMIQQISVCSMTFDSVFRMIGRDAVDWLQIDCEGLDAELLRLYDVPRRKPKVITFEHKHLSTNDYLRAVRMLSACGYRIVLLDESEDDTMAFLP